MTNYLFNCPLFLVLHGNNPTIWKQQLDRSKRWELPRVPYLRIRPRTSIIHHTESVMTPSDCDITFGVELGVVIGRDAKNVSEEKAMDYIGGYTCVNDLYSTIYHSYFDESISTPESAERLDKGISGNYHRYRAEDRT